MEPPDFFIGLKNHWIAVCNTRKATHYQYNHAATTFIVWKLRNALLSHYHRLGLTASWPTGLIWTRQTRFVRSHKITACSSPSLHDLGAAVRGVHQAAAEPAGREPQLCGGGREVLRVPGQQQGGLAGHSSGVPWKWLDSSETHGLISILKTVHYCESSEVLNCKLILY